MKTVLIVTYFFPPFPTIGSVRLGGLARHLPSYGYHPIILTHTLPGQPDPSFQVIQTAYHDRLTTAAPISNTNGKRKLTTRLAKWIMKGRSHPSPALKRVVNLAGEVLSFPDGKKAWRPIALEAAADLLARIKIDVLISSSSPETTHLIACDLKSRYGIPWMADLRDPWTTHPYYPYSGIRRFFEAKLERRTLGMADAISIASPQWAQEMQTRHPDIPVHMILNGYDPQEMYTLPLAPRFTITHTGSLYDGRRGPTPFFQALQELLREGTLGPQDIQVNLYDYPQDWLENMIHEYNLTGIVKQCGRISRNEALVRQRESHILLLINNADPKTAGNCPAKIYEYFAARRPVLSIGTPQGGVVQEILNDTQAGVCPSDPAAIKESLQQYLHEFRQTGSIAFHGSDTAIAHYSHPEMARRFATVLDGILQAKDIC